MDWPIPSLNPNDVRPVGELVAVLTPDQLDPGELGLGLAGLVPRGAELGLVGGEDGDGDVDVGGAEGLLPVVGTAFTGVAQDLGPGRHTFAELRGEAVQGRLRHPERLQPLVGEGDGDRRLVRLTGGRGGVDDPVQSSHQLASVVAVADAEQQVGADVRRGTFEQSAGLDVVELE